jgi:hypothetical protein
LVGDRPYGPDEVAAAFGAEVAGVIAWDPRTAAVLSGTHGAVRDLRRSLLVRSAATLAASLTPPRAVLDQGMAMGSAAEVVASKVAEETGS